MSVTKVPYGTTRDGQAVEKYTLTAGNRSAEIITYGATVVSLRVPDQNGQPVDVVLGYRCLSGYEDNSGYLGAVVGRCANRIAGASFTIDGVSYALEANEGSKQLHGGPHGYSTCVFKAEITGESSVTMTYTEPDGANGYPGTIDVAVTYQLSGDGLSIRYRASCDKPTYCNLTNHSYFNLNGGGDILGHRLWIKADAFTPIDAQSIPIALSTPVAGTPFDFTAGKPIGQGIDADDAQIALVGGYDHNFVLGNSDAVRCVARLTGEKSGIVMETWTCQSGVQLYTSNALTTDSQTKSGKPYGKWEAVCLETQMPPDSPNHPEWGDTVLRPGQTYEAVTEYRFYTKSDK